MNKKAKSKLFNDNKNKSWNKNKFFSLFIFLGIIFFLFLILLFKNVILREKSNKNDVIVKSEYQEKEKKEGMRFRIIDNIVNFLHLGPEVPPPPKMNWIKYQGCVTDGLLNGYGDKTEEMIAMVNRSECKYLHRAIETWLDAPDFKKIKKNMKKLNKEKGFVVGMFFAEAIDKKDEFYFSNEGRNFNFSRMCRQGSDNFWGEHTCIPSFSKKEYRQYVLYTAEKAMDLGVQVFLFGQVYYQDDISQAEIAQVLADMREYADFRGIKILIGAQTNDIADEKYLKLFDFIEGGVGIDKNGRIEDLPCSSKWWDKQKGGWCWALLWHERYLKKANNVLVHLDWSGKIGDDMSIFAKMNSQERIRTLSNLYENFKKKGVGFLVPFLAVLPRNNGSCFGPIPGYYSADNQYGCKDEDGINKILKQNQKNE